MKTIRLNRWHILLPILIWWLLFITLSAFNFNRFELLNIVGFLFLAIAPGLLTMLASRIRGLPFWGYATLTVGFSLLELMLLALLGNTFLPFAGITRPLDKAPLLFELYPLIAVLAAVVWLRVKEIDITVKKYLLFDNLRDWIFSFAPIIFVGLAVLGTISLNDGGSNIWTMVMLGGMGMYIVFLMIYTKELDENTTLTSLFFMALSLLLMTNLRGWYITGHDIQNEYKVFELTKNAGLWNIAAYQDAYNACLSITILPTIISNLLNFPDPYVYKFFFQIFFALCPGLVYLIGRHWTSRRISLIGTIFFMGFPTFFTDMPFLNRQEVAFLFYGLMLYIIFEPKLDLRIRQLLFILMGIGVILSHYSTTYTVLVVFGLAVIFRPLFLELLAWLKSKPRFKDTAITVPLKSKTTGQPKITLVMVAVLFGLSFVWTSIITKTGNNVTAVIGQTFAAVKDGFGSGNRSIDVTTLLTFTKPNQSSELQSYITNVIDPIRASSSPEEYFPEQTYDQYLYTPLSPETTPLDDLGKSLGNLGINTEIVIPAFGELIAKLTEILVPIGMIYLLLSQYIVTSVDDELYLIALFCLVFIAMNIILPILSTEYGIFRAMQQSMFVIAPIIAIGSVALGNWLFNSFKPLKKYITGERFAVALTGAFFFYSTSFLPYLFGGATAALHLSNMGTYYDNYFIQETEVYGVEWLTSIASTAATNGVRINIQTTKYNKFASLTSLDAYTDIFPGVIQKDGYVFLGPTTVINRRATVIDNADPVTYAYPIQFLEDNKNLIYDNGGAEVYR
jgi:uncharacterized membrane protein